MDESREVCWRRVAWVVFATALITTAGLSSGCGSPAGPSANPRTPVLVLGIDGFEWDVLGPLVEAGEMPNFAKLMEQGQFGVLETIRPTLSPIVWTSMATGKRPQEHGVRGFVKKRSADGRESRRLYNSNDRNSKAFWNITSDYGISTAVIGWWLTYPTEEIEGVMVAQVNTLASAEQERDQAMRKGRLQEGIEGQIFPAERAADLFAVHDRIVNELPQRVQEIFDINPSTVTPLTEKHWANTQWAFRADAVYLEIAETLAAEGFDLVVCYVGGADVTGHRYWRHFRPEEYDYPPTSDEIAAFADVIPDYYRFLDQALGGLRAAMPKDTNILVVTDHGMGAVNRDTDFSDDDAPENINSGHHMRGWPGVMIVSGPDFRQGSHFGRSWRKQDLPNLASVYDVTPSLLTLLGIPVGEDMTGTPMPAISVEATGTVPTHDSEEWLATRSRQLGDRVEDDPERMRQLRALGYID